MEGVQLILEKLEVIDRRLENLEKRMDSLEKRMDSLEKRVDSLEKRVNCLEQEVKALRQDMMEQFETLDYAVDYKMEKVYQLAVDHKHKLIVIDQVIENIHKGTDRTTLEYTEGISV